MPYGIAFVRRHVVVLCLALPWLAGCAAFHPMKGIPVRYLDDNLKVGHRSGKRTIDLSLLSQNWNGVHLVDSGDILGIYIGGVLGKVNENPQVLLSQNADFQPAAGVPVSVREDGTISLPMIGSLLVRGKTIRETEDAIREAYTNHAAGKEFLKPDQERVLVGLQRARQTRVLVVRQDSRNEPLANAAAGMLNIGAAKRGTGRVISLPAYRNDVLNALVMSEGLPGLDAQNEVYIIRRKPNVTGPDLQFQDPIDPAAIIRQTKQPEKPVIRGQSPGGWTVEVEGQDSGSNLNGPGYRSQGFPSSQSYGRRNPVQQGYSNRSFPNRSIGQAAIDAQQDSGPIGFDPLQQRGFDSREIDRASYQNPQPWGPPNGMSQQWNGDPSQDPYGPSTLRNPAQPPMNSMPSSPLQPQPDYSNSQAPQNWPRQWNGGNPSPNPYSSSRYPPVPSQNPMQSPMNSTQAPSLQPQPDYSNPQAPQNGPTPWNGGNTSSSPYSSSRYSPTPLQNPAQPPMNPAQVPPLQPQPDFSNSQAPQNWPPQQPVGMQPNFGGQVPTPGYSLQGSGPAINGVDVNGRQGDPRGFDQPDSPGSQDIGLVDGRRIIRIPIRLGPDEHIDIRKEDVILHDGDIVFIEARDTEVFFTGGLLGGGQFTLPRDFDLDILQALSIATSRVGTTGAARQIGGVSALNSDVTISPSNVVIIRKLPEGGEIPIKVDLYQARNDLSERIVIQPGDYIYLQYTPMEAIGAFLDRHLLEGALFGLFTQQLNRPTN